MKFVNFFLVASMMSVILAPGIVGGSAFAQGFGQPCAQKEMQFFGTVRSVRTDRIDQGQFDCWIQINFTSFRHQGECPLDPSMVDEVYVGPYHCSNAYEVGDEISGILVQKDGYTYLE